MKQLSQTPIVLSRDKRQQLEKALTFMIAEWKRVGYVQDDEDAPATFGGSAARRDPQEHP